jgi:hypothetical protein
MSVSASIVIALTESIPAVEIIRKLTIFGWNLTNEYGYVNYLPIGDKDNFDWQAERTMSFEALTKILNAKEQACEIVGVILTWKDTNIGGTFLFQPKKSLETFSMHISIERQKILLSDGYEITDFQWYLSKLLPPLNEMWTVEYFSLDQHI